MRVIATSSSADVKRYQDTISGTCSSEKHVDDTNGLASCRERKCSDTITKYQITKILMTVLKNKFIVIYYNFRPSVLWRCWLGGRKGIRPVKNLEWWGTGVVICLERRADLHMAQLMPPPITVSCSMSRRCDFDRDSASSLSAQKLPYVESHKF